jgi:hypothetical protein
MKAVLPLRCLSYLMSHTESAKYCCAWLAACREPEGGVPDDWPESDDDEPTASGDVSDPLGLLTWPLESSKTARGSSIASSAAAGLAGAAAALVGLAGSGNAAGGGGGAGTGLSVMSGAGRGDRDRLSSVSMWLRWVFATSGWGWGLGVYMQKMEWQNIPGTAARSAGNCGSAGGASRVWQCCWWRCWRRHRTGGMSVLAGGKMR